MRVRQLSKKSYIWPPKLMKYETDILRSSFFLSPSSSQVFKPFLHIKYWCVLQKVSGGAPLAVVIEWLPWNSLKASNEEGWKGTKVLKSRNMRCFFQFGKSKKIDYSKMVCEHWTLEVHWSYRHVQWTLDIISHCCFCYVYK